MADQAARHFLPWVREGTAAAIATADTLTSNQPAQVSFPVKVTLANFDPFSAQIGLYGPGDVTGIDPWQIVRLEPGKFTTTFESNQFPAIEFDRPDFPWLFTPANTGQKDRLRPWICLIAVKKQEGVHLSRNANSTLPFLKISSPARPATELPDLDESWAWAHAQVTGSLTDSMTLLKAAIVDAPERTVARLLCPRHLIPETAYYACVVPTFEVGRKTGLGIPVTDADLSHLAPAWEGTATEVLLPVYYSWEFSTGPAGDFESLVRDLQPRPIPDTVGTIFINIGHPGFGLPQLPETVIPMHGVLLPVRSQLPSVAAVPQELRAGLANILNAPADARIQPEHDPVVAPPIYGAPYPSPPKHRVELTSSSPPWVNELNLDPRHRIAASLGAQVVQQDQDVLMTAAWEQIEGIHEVNQERRHRQLAMVTRTVTFQKHILRLAPDALLQITGPSLAKVRATIPEGTVTVASKILESEFPAFSMATLRRVARPRGPLNRRALAGFESQPKKRPLVKLEDSLPVLRPRPLRPVPLPFRQRIPGMVTVKKVSDASGEPLVDSMKLTPAKVQAEPAHGFYVWKVDHWELSSAAFGKEFRQAAFNHLSRVVHPNRPRKNPFIKPSIQELLNQLHPQKTNVRANTRGPASLASEEDPVLVHPHFSRPMSERLIDLTPDFLLPGLEHVPANTVTLVKPNTRLIEAFMLGLNHEMGRELLWREYPTDQRGTYFRYFWDERGAQPQSAASSLALPAIHTWNQSLGKNVAEGANTDPLILLVRGELFRRYPTAIVYAVKASRDSAGRLKPSQTGDERYPLFRGSTPPDVTFFGFELTSSLARGQDGRDAGWFFVIQQQPGEPNFGLDELDPGESPAPLSSWNDLTWRHLVRSEAELESLMYVRVNPGDSPVLNTPANPEGAQWGMNAAHMARITLQQPVRICIHASLLLPPEPSSPTPPEGGPHG